MIDTQPAELTRKPLESAPSGQPTLTELVGGIADDAQRLIKQQYQMLRVEMKEDFRRTVDACKYMSIGAGAAIVGVFFLLIALPLLLNYLFNLPPWAGWAIIGGILVLVGGIALYAGYRIFRNNNPLPDKTLHALEENLSWATNHRS
jgi:Putative Actinobacterial Holin-X, holin superfamily III